MESHESTRQRAQCFQSKIHEDHSAGKGFIYFDDTLPFGAQILPMPKAMKNLDAKAAVDKECKKLERIPAWNLETSQEQEGGYSSGAKEETRMSTLCRLQRQHLK